MPTDHRELLWHNLRHGVKSRYPSRTPKDSKSSISKRWKLCHRSCRLWRSRGKISGKWRFTKSMPKIQRTSLNTSSSTGMKTLLKKSHPLSKSSHRRFRTSNIVKKNSTLPQRRSLLPNKSKSLTSRHHSKTSKTVRPSNLSVSTNNWASRSKGGSSTRNLS